eukprot:SAG31_NODE_23594_length_501_cov_0.634328_1_plen_124_part_10
MAGKDLKPVFDQSLSKVLPAEVLSANKVLSAPAAAAKDGTDSSQITEEARQARQRSKAVVPKAAISNDRIAAMMMDGDGGGRSDDIHTSELSLAGLLARADFEARTCGMELSLQDELRRLMDRS